MLVDNAVQGSVAKKRVNKTTGLLTEVQAHAPAKQCSYLQAGMDVLQDPCDEAPPGCMLHLSPFNSCLVTPAGQVQTNHTLSP